MKQIVLKNSFCELFYQNNSKKKNLLFIHGFGANARTTPIWYNAFLKRNYNIYMLNFPGITELSAKTSEMDIFYFSTLIEALIAKYALKNVTLVGHSMGGGIAMLIINFLVNKISKAILIAPMNRTSLSKEAIFQETFFPKNYQNYKKLIDLLHFQGFRFYDTPLKNEALKKRYMEERKNLYERETYQILGKSLPSELNMITIENGIRKTKKLFLIYGDHDGIIDLEKISPYFLKLNPQTKIAIIKNSGHSPWVENSSEFFKVFEKFLQA